MRKARIEYNTMNDESCRISNAFPYVFPMSSTHKEFPASKSTIEQSGAPLGCFVKPFLPLFDRSNITAHLPLMVDSNKELARCKNCHAYLNQFCDVTNIKWICALCGERNLFTKNQTRYKYVDGTALPELNSVINDFPRLFTANDDGYIPSKLLNSNKISTKIRPLVHIFLIQENMPVDVIQSAVEALTHCLNTMHKDVHILLITFSNRVCIYNFSAVESDINQESIQIPSANIVYFTDEWSDDIGDSGVALDAKDVATPKNYKTTIPLSDVCHFKDCISRIGDCRHRVINALPLLFDTANDINKTSEVLILPAISAIVDWIMKEPTSNEPAVSGLEPNSSLGGTVLSLLKTFSMFNLDNNSVKSKQSERDVYSYAAIDSCSGVVLNAFISTNGCASRSSTHHDLCTSLGRSCGHSGLSFNIYSIVSFESQQVELHNLSPLAEYTGGRIHRFVLGNYPKDEIIRLKESLRRDLSKQIATKGIFKVRTSKLIQPNATKVTGYTCPDDSLPNVYRFARCCGDATMGLELAYCEISEPDKTYNRAETSDSIYIQVAFSYETLVEDSGESKSIAERNNTENEYLAHIFNTLGLQKNYECLIQRVNSMSNNSAEDDIPFYLETDLSRYYNPNKDLVCVKRLRVITVELETTPQVQRLCGAIHNPSLSLLVARHCLNVARPETTVSKASTHPGLGIVHDWAVSILLATTMNIAKKFTDGSGPGYSDDTYLNEAMRYLQGLHLTQLLFGVYNCIRKFSSHKGLLSDELVSLASIIQNVDAYSAATLFYPSFHAIHDVGHTPEIPHVLTVNSDILQLRRESIVNTNSVAYVVDSLSSITLYYPFSSPLLHAEKSSSNIKCDVDASQLHSNANWIVNDLIRRAILAPVTPNIYLSEAGTDTAYYLNHQLIEDGDGNNSYQDFMRSIYEAASQCIENSK